MTKISIYKVEAKETKTNKPYLLVETSTGKMSVFDEGLFKNINESIGKEVQVNVVVSGNYTNIVGFVDTIGEASAKPEEPKEKSFGREPNAIIRTDCYKMAIDLAIAGKINAEQIETTAEDLFEKINK